MGFFKRWSHLCQFREYTRSAGALPKATDVDRTIPIILPGVKQDGTVNDFQTSIDRTYFNTYLGAAEQFLYDATCVRLRELSLSYAIPKDRLEKTPFGGIQFTLSGQNLFHYAPNFLKVQIMILKHQAAEWEKQEDLNS